MIGRARVQPLDESWRETLDAVSRARRWPSSNEPAKLGALVARLSAMYNELPPAPGAPPPKPLAPEDALAARLGFSFARDVPKGAAAVRELVACGALAAPGDRPLRVLDFGAGLGAMTWGALRALGDRVRAEATWIDASPRAMELGEQIVRARRGDPIELEVRAVRDLAAAGAAFDLVLVGQTLSEMDATDEPAARVEKHAALLASLLERAAPEGALVVIEPALRARTRHLHAVRDALLARPGAPSVFAPCLHAAPCPALAREGDWCHEDVDVDLPAWLVPVARAAGLRWERLTFSYLVLRKDGRTLDAFLAPRTPEGAVRLRVVSGAMRTKGKREAFLCGGGERLRAMRLDREASASNAPFEEIGRGDVVSVAPPLDRERPRVGRDAVVARLDLEEPRSSG